MISSSQYLDSVDLTHETVIMPYFSLFGQQNGHGRIYAPVSEEEDKMLEDDAQHSQHSEELQSLQHSNKKLRILLTSAAVGFCLLLGLFVLRNWQHATRANLIPQILRTPVPQSKSLCTQEFPTGLTNYLAVPMNTYTFKRNELYASRPSPESDAAWNALLPKGRGFVFVEDSQQYGVPPGEQTFVGEIYSVSLFHQLHCLGTLRKFYWMLVEGVNNNDTRLPEMAEKLLGPGGEHVHHCFDYLRQTLQCAGDMALEWPREEPDGRRFAVDGWVSIS